MRLLLFYNSIFDKLSFYLFVLREIGYNVTSIKTNGKTTRWLWLSCSSWLLQWEVIDAAGREIMLALLFPRAATDGLR